MRYKQNMDYRIEVYQGKHLIAWTVVNVTEQGMATESNVLDNDLARLASYDLLLLSATNLCPFDREKAWLEKRNQEHARIDPDAYVKHRGKAAGPKRLDETDIPF